MLNEKKAKIYTILWLSKNSRKNQCFLKIVAQVFEAGDFLNIF